ncbi:hypothetical protein AB0B10_25330 [Micromonospora arborensis]|uniref:hypothetical protein n=1 Tax=Micromonospora arborensis TaxID=2116518 RepID=UPI0033C17238
MTIAPGTLAGSPKQTRWADNIRSETMTELDAASIADDTRAATVKLLTEVTDATWWIETRNVLGDQWPANLGVTTPAVEQRPHHRQTDGAKQRLASRMAAAQRVRDVLDTAGVHRTAYRLTIDLGDRLSISQTDCSGSTDQRKAERLALADQIVTAIGQAARPLRDPEASRKALANGGAAPINDEGGQR